MKHKHAELIKAWADGAEIQVKAHKLIWEDRKNPLWDTDSEYRIKPESDVVKHFFVESHFWAGIRLSEASQLDTPVLSITFDGETGKLKSAEVI
jgi:hypothetical protein